MTEEKVDATQVTPEDEGAGDAKPADPPKPTLTQDDVDRIVTDRLKRKDEQQAREKAETERKAREQALQDQEDWKKLAEERTSTIEQKDKQIIDLQETAEERNVLQDRVSTLEDRLAGLIKPQLEAVPELFRPFVQEKTVEEQAEWLEKNAEKLTTIGATPERPAGSRPTGRPSTPPRAEADKEAREGQRQARVSAI